MVRTQKANFFVIAVPMIMNEHAIIEKDQMLKVVKIPEPVIKEYYYIILYHYFDLCYEC